MQSARTIGVLLGLSLGIVWVWLGFGAAVLVGSLALLGWLVGGVVASASAGHLNLEGLWDDLLGRERATP